MDSAREVPLPKTKECEGWSVEHWSEADGYDVHDARGKYAAFIEDSLPTSALLAIVRDRLEEIADQPGRPDPEDDPIVSAAVHVGFAIRHLEEADR